MTTMMTMMMTRGTYATFLPQQAGMAMPLVPQLVPPLVPQLGLPMAVGRLGPSTVCAHLAK